jgi:hypothetical protein
VGADANIRASAATSPLVSARPSLLRRHSTSSAVHAHSLLGLFQGRRATDHHHPRDWDAVAMAMTSTKSKRFNPLSLDAVNLLLSNVRGALGLISIA